MSVVHVAVTWHVRPGKEQEFESSVCDFIHRSRYAPGTRGALLIGPVPGASEGEYGIMRTFEDEAARDAFYEAPLFREWEQSAEGLVEGRPNFRRLTGMEAFFRNRGPRQPPRWKMALLTWVGVMPTALLWRASLETPLTGTHFLLAAMIVNAFVVATLAWFVMPLLTKLFARWLHG